MADDPKSSIQPSQILCLEHESGHLYVELIQKAAFRDLYWVRPIVLMTNVGDRPSFPSSLTHTSDDLILYDLRKEVDLLWPMSVFRTVLDVEIIPLLAQLGTLKQTQERDYHIHEIFQKFIHDLWHAYPDAF
jgi:hypothetical protein